MKPRGVKQLVVDENGNSIALCKDGTMWIAFIGRDGSAQWKRVKDIPKVDYQGPC